MPAKVINGGINPKALDFLLVELEHISREKIEFQKMSRLFQIVQLFTFSFIGINTEKELITSQSILVPVVFSTVLLSAVCINAQNNILSRRYNEFKSNIVRSAGDELADDIIRVSHDYNMIERFNKIIRISSFEPFVFALIIFLSFLASISQALPFSRI